MKFTTTTSRERVSGRFRENEEAPYFINGTHATVDFEDDESAVPTAQPQEARNSPPLPAYFTFDTPIRHSLGPSEPLEWSTFHHTTARSHVPFGIYGTSSDYFVAEDLTFAPALPSPISSLGSPDMQIPFDRSAMIWEQLATSECTDLVNTKSPSHITTRDHHQSFNDSMEMHEETELTIKSPLGPPVLPTNSRSSSFSAAGDFTESSAGSTYEEPEMPPAKRPRTSAPSPRWSTSRRTRKKKLEQTTIIFPQSPPSSSTSKTNHNAIEKQYRNRLNDKFEALLSVLPAQETEGRRGSFSKVSKGDVLILAKDYIEILEKSRDEMQEDRRLLQEDIDGLKEAWLQSGRVARP